MLLKIYEYFKKKMFPAGRLASEIKIIAVTYQIANEEEPKWNSMTSLNKMSKIISCKPGVVKNSDDGTGLTVELISKIIGHRWWKKKSLT